MSSTGSGATSSTRPRGESTRRSTLVAVAPRHPGDETIDGRHLPRTRPQGSGVDRLQAGAAGEQACQRRDQAHHHKPGERRGSPRRVGRSDGGEQNDCDGRHAERS